MELFKELNGERIQAFQKVEIDGQEFYQETEEWKQKSQEFLFNEKFSKSGLPNHVRNLSLDSYVGDTEKISKMKLYIHKFGSKFKQVHLYFWSSLNTTQKTTMASIVGKDLIKKGFSVQFILMNTLIKLLSNNERDIDEESSLLLTKLSECDYLIIDDSFDKKKATIYRSGYQIPFLDEFLRMRLEVNKKATCFTSNFALNEIDSSVFGESLVKLMQRSILDPFFFETSYLVKDNFNPRTLWS